MGVDREITSKLDLLRRRAEQSLADRQAEGFKDPEATSEELPNLLHTLQTYQIELELQNEELRSAQVELERVTEKFKGLFEFAPVGYLTVGRDGRIREANLTAITLLRMERMHLIGSKMTTLVAPGGQDDYYLLRRRAEVSGIREKGVFQMIGGNGSFFHAELHISATPALGQGVDEFLVVVSDITARIQSEAALKALNEKLDQRIEQRTKELTLANKSLEAEAAARTRVERKLRMSEEMYRELVENVNNIIMRVARDGRISFLNTYGQSFFGRGTGDMLDREVMDTIKSGIDLADDDYQWTIDEWWQFAEDHPIGKYEYTREDGERVWISWTIRPVFDNDNKLKEYYCVGSDITTCKLREAEIFSISETIQNRIGDDLHDSVGQQLAGVIYSVGSLEKKLASGTLPEAAEAADIIKQLEVATAEVRSLAQGLHPVVMEDDGLTTALESLAREVRDHFEINCQCRWMAAVPVRDNNVATHLFRIAQEAIANIIRHAEAGNIIIGLERQDELIVMTISDDGRGLAKDRPGKRGQGLHIMAGRAGMIGGRLRVAPNVKGGTTVTCTTSEKRNDQGP